MTVHACEYGLASALSHLYQEVPPLFIGHLEPSGDFSTRAKASGAAERHVDAAALDTGGWAGQNQLLCLLGFSPLHHARKD